MHFSDMTAWRHTHAFEAVRRQGEHRTRLVFLLTASMMFVEIAVGIRSGSMALLADGIHMGSHTVAIGLAAFAYAYARRHASDQRFSFGTGKINSLAGFTGALLLGVFALFMIWQSIDRFINPVDIAIDIAIVVAAVGLLVNGASALILRGNSEETEHGHHQSREHQDHNLRSAYLHVLADALTSMTAIFALGTAKYFGMTWMDPLMGIVGSIVIIYWARGLLKSTAGVLLDHQAPSDLVEKVRFSIEEDDDNSLADIHIWPIGPARYAATLGVVTHNPKEAEHYKNLLPTNLGIAHITVEVNRCTGGDPSSCVPPEGGNLLTR